MRIVSWFFRWLFRWEKRSHSYGGRGLKRGLRWSKGVAWKPGVSDGIGTTLARPILVKCRRCHRTVPVESGIAHCLCGIVLRFDKVLRDPEGHYEGDAYNWRIVRLPDDHSGRETINTGTRRI
jgi:hypothetical protein